MNTNAQSYGKSLRLVSTLAVVAAAAAVAAPAAAPAAAGCDLLGPRNSIKGFYRVAVLACPDEVRIDEPTSWTIRVTTRAGAPVRGRVQVTGGMPEHGHGFLTRPVVTRGRTAGIYRARLVFAMGGRWVIEFRISAKGRRDLVRYELGV